MPVAMLLLAVTAALAGAGAVWTMASFWWALVAYSGIGAATMLLMASALYFAAPRGEAEERFAVTKLRTAE